MENLLHYIWKQQLHEGQLCTTNGETIEVLDTGIPNNDEGPDFFNAKIKIGETIWAGNIEIHLTSKEWNRHNRQTNPKYDSVILHIVDKADCEVYNSKGQAILQCELSYPNILKNNYEYLIHSDQVIACANYLGEIPQLKISGWLNSLVVERLERKTNDIKNLLVKYQNSWEDVFYITLCRNFGFGLNAEPFEQLALSLPYKYILKHKDDITQIEALLFGQSGILDEDNDDLYFQKLKSEYEFLKVKYDLEPLDKNTLKSLRVRPNSFPHLRIAQLASLIWNSEHLFAQAIECKDIDTLRLSFHFNASSYWQTHYTFGYASEHKSKYLGDASIDILLINTVIPLLFVYGKSVGDDNICNRALSFLEEIKPENNGITREFHKYGINARNAFESQALIQLKKMYCQQKRCIFCRFGHQFLKNSY